MKTSVTKIEGVGQPARVYPYIGVLMNAVTEETDCVLEPYDIAVLFNGNSRGMIVAAGATKNSPFKVGVYNTDWDELSFTVLPFGLEVNLSNS